ncbi:MAG: DUF302 domain-containing protein [Candidatus Zixiibacteriota bacterium]
MHTATQNDIAYRLESDKPFSTVAQNLETISPKHQFRVLAVHDVQATLAEKGFERGPLKIIEVCNAGFANEALNKDVNVSLFMPCRYSVYEDSGKTIVTLARPSVISQMLPDSGLEEMAAKVEETLVTIMKEAI